MRRFTIKGQFWSAGDTIYVDTQNDDGEYTVVSLNHLIQDNIKQESKVTIVIDVE